MTHRAAKKLYKHWKDVIGTQLETIKNLVQERDEDIPHYGHVGDLANVSNTLDVALGALKQVDDYDSGDLYDVVRVFFVDGTSTVINVLYDEVIQDAIVEMCEAEGYDLSTVSEFSIVG